MSSKACPKCGEANNPLFTQCWKCKFDFTQRKCPYCAELVKAEAVKCRFCGEKLDPVELPTTKDTISEEALDLSTPQSLKFQSGKLQGVFSVVLFFFVAWVIYSGVMTLFNPSPMSQSSPEKPTSDTTNVHSKSYSHEHFILKDGHFGCLNSSDYSKLVRYVSVGDTEAFQQGLAAGLVSGICTMFKQGEVVYIAQNKLTTVKIRRKGEMQEYWTVTEAVGK